MPNSESADESARGVAFAVLCAWVGAWLWIGRHHLLDDAFIHLRYAENLLATGRLSFNGDDSNYGTSSLLYVLLLAGCRALIDTPLLPKLVSSLAYLIGWSLVANNALRASRSSRGAWGLLLLSLSGPLGTRWLTDGMETSLVVATAIALAYTLHRSGCEPSGGRRLAGACLAAGLVLLRVETALVVATTVAASMLLSRARGVSWVGAARDGLPVMAASAIALLTIWTGMGHLLPDTAVAKTGTAPFAASNVRAIAASIVSSGSFGCGLSAAWIASLVAALATARGDRMLRLSVAAANATFPAVVLLALARGQIVQGVRYFVWALVAGIVWNALCVQLRRDHAWLARRTWRVSVVALAALLIATAWVESAPALRILEGRSATYLRMARADFGGFASRRAVAADIGMFGYFTRATVCDLSGLVNGRAFAALGAGERARRCALQEPVVAFLTSDQRRALAGRLDLGSWLNCGHVDFTNFRSADRHALLVRPGHGLRCPPGFAPSR